MKFQLTRPCLVGFFYFFFAILEFCSAAPSKPAVCFRCITKGSNFGRNKESCVKAVKCDLSGQCFKAILDGDLTIRGCPLGSETNLQAIGCDRIREQIEKNPSLKAKLGGKDSFTRSHFEASCGKNVAAAKKPQILFCRGAGCNAASGLTPTIKLGIVAILISVVYGRR